MAIPEGAHKAVYEIGGVKRSLLDLLGRFAEPQYQSKGILRLSDLHLKVGEPARFRFDNELVPVPQGEPLTAPVVEALILPLLNPAQLRRLMGMPPDDVDSSFDWEERRLSFRVNVFHDRDGLAATLRALPRFVPDIEQVGFPNDVWREIVELNQGLIIVTGITGSGKSTTIASLLKHINRKQRARIITLEDPVEYVMSSEHAMISQREVGTHVASFEEGLRSALREDPDIIFVGEMRDRETTSLALTAAETGHLVLSTLHTRDTKGVISRIVDMFPAERNKELSTQLSFSLSLVLGQKLVTRLNGQGRCAAVEVLRVTPAVGHLIRSGNWHQIYGQLETGSKVGMISMEKHLAQLCKEGVISRDEALRHANDPVILNYLNAG